MVFLDTNIWNYAVLNQDGNKRSQAQYIIRRALSENNFAISTQVISECAATLQKKGHLQAAEILRFVHYMQHVKNIVQVTPAIIIRAIELQKIYSLSLYDAQIVAAAEQSECQELWSEDLQHNAHYGTVHCVNPFLEG